LNRLLRSIAVLLVAGCTAPQGGAPGLILGPDRAETGEAALIEALGRARIVVLGEMHDNRVHHARQAQIVEALQPGGIAFEMVPEASEEGIQVFLAQGGARGEIGPAIGWAKLRWPDWKMYKPVFEAARGAYVAGGGVPKPELRRAMKEGAGTVYGVGADGLGLDQPLDPATQIEVEDEMIASHCNKLPREVASGMVESQRLRDARFAAATLRALDNAANGRAVLITGNGHARTDRGVPLYLRLAAPRLAVLSVGMIELPPGRDPQEAAAGLPFDYVWFSEPAKREDPCAAFN